MPGRAAAGADQVHALGEGVEGVHIVSQSVVGAGEAQVQVGQGGQVLECGEAAGRLQAAVGLQAHRLQPREAQQRLYDPRPHRRHPHLRACRCVLSHTEGAQWRIGACRPWQRRTSMGLTPLHLAHVRVTWPCRKAWTPSYNVKTMGWCPIVRVYEDTKSTNEGQNEVKPRDRWTVGPSGSALH